MTNMDTDRNVCIYRARDFVTVIGGNGAGKSTLLNSIAGSFPIDSGQILIDGVDVTDEKTSQRAKYISRVFQDPGMGSATRLSIEQNLSIAYSRGKKRGLKKVLMSKIE